VSRWLLILAVARILSLLGRFLRSPKQSSADNLTRPSQASHWAARSIISAIAAALIVGFLNPIEVSANTREWRPKTRHCLFREVSTTADTSLTISRNVTTNRVASSTTSDVSVRGNGHSAEPWPVPLAKQPFKVRRHDGRRSTASTQPFVSLTAGLSPLEVATARPHHYDAPHRLRKPRNGMATKRGPCVNSFAYDTQVIMADGTRKPISQLKIGDTVIATDPETGVTAERAVTAVHLNLDTDLAVVTVVDADGDVSTINTTQHHPFWNVTDSTWTDVIDLDAGDRLRSTDGSLLTVVSVRAFAGEQWMWDLTVDDIHTFYVANGDEPVLVHNCSLDDLSAAGRAPAKGGRTSAGRAYQKHMDRGELPKVSGSDLDSAGQTLLDDILTAPGTKSVIITSGNFAGGVRYIRPDGVGVTFYGGKLQYFGVGYS
jgi:hypothetical protein